MRYIHVSAMLGHRAAAAIATLPMTLGPATVRAEELPVQPAEAVASISQLELLLTESVCSEAALLQQWGLDKIACMQELFELEVVAGCTTTNMAKIPAPDNLPDGERLTMASFSTVYAQCLIAGKSALP